MLFSPLTLYHIALFTPPRTPVRRRDRHVGNDGTFGPDLGHFITMREY